MKGEARYAAARRVTLVGAAVNVVLAALKVAFGYIGQSQGLIADGLHSLSDLLSDGVVLIASRHGSREADAEHPYGHGRIETAFTVGLGVLLGIIAAGILWDAFRRLLNPEALWHPGLLALSIALLSVIAKEVLYRYTLKVAKALRSNLLRANAWHHRSDALSSIVVVFGILGVQGGFPALDAIAAIGVALMIGKIAWDLGWHSLKELVDTALEAERVEAIRRTILEVEGVESLHQLRTRRMGGAALVDVHIQVDPRISVTEGHQIGEAVRQRLMETFEDIADVTVHIDPENDEKAPLNLDLPLRRTLLKELGAHWKDIPGASLVHRINLHYLDGRIQVEIFLPCLKDPGRAGDLTSALKKATLKHPQVASVEVYMEGCTKDVHLTP